MLNTKMIKCSQLFRNNGFCQKSKFHKFMNFSIFVNLRDKSNFFMIYYLYVLLLIWFTKIKFLAFLNMCLRGISLYFCYCFIFNIIAEIWHQGYTDLKIFGNLWTWMYFYFFLCMNIFTNTFMHACTLSSKVYLVLRVCTWILGMVLLCICVSALVKYQ